MFYLRQCFLLLPANNIPKLMNQKIQLHLLKIIGFPPFSQKLNNSSTYKGTYMGPSVFSRISSIFYITYLYKEYFIWICNHLIFEVSVQHTYYNRQTWSQNLCLFDGWWQQCIFHAQLDRLDICNLFRIRRRIDPALFGFIQSASISWLKWGI